MFLWPQFGFEVGLPAKSGVAGCVLLVVPGKFGLCVWSPPLDEVGNSVRGVELCRNLAKYGPGDNHMFRNVGWQEVDRNPDLAFYSLMNACQRGDTPAVAKLIASVELNRADYDGRTPLHIACCEARSDIVALLLQGGAITTLRDRWGNTAIEDVNRLRKNEGDDHDRILMQIQAHIAAQI